MNQNEKKFGPSLSEVMAEIMAKKDAKLAEEKAVQTVQKYLDGDINLIDADLGYVYRYNNKGKKPLSYTEDGKHFANWTKDELIELVKNKHLLTQEDYQQSKKRSQADEDNNSARNIENTSQNLNLEQNLEEQNSNDKYITLRIKDIKSTNLEEIETQIEKAIENLNEGDIVLNEKSKTYREVYRNNNDKKVIEFTSYNEYAGIVNEEISYVELYHRSLEDHNDYIFITASQESSQQAQSQEYKKALEAIEEIKQKLNFKESVDSVEYSSIRFDNRFRQRSRIDFANLDRTQLLSILFNLETDDKLLDKKSNIEMIVLSNDKSSKIVTFEIRNHDQNNNENSDNLNANYQVEMQEIPYQFLLDQKNSLYMVNNLNWIQKMKNWLRLG